MEFPLQILADPLIVIALAILIFAVRVIYLAKRLKFAAKNPTLVDVKALEEARKALDAHRESLNDAKATLSGNIEGARDTLRHYRRPLQRARAERQKAIGKAMRHSALEDARKLYTSVRPRRRRRAGKEAPKDI